MVKLRKLHIDDYKMFKDFDISFVDKEDVALPIVVLAGVNGSGKTTLLEYLNQSIFMIGMIKGGDYLELGNLKIDYIINREIIKKKKIFDSQIEKQRNKNFSEGHELFGYSIPQDLNGVYDLENDIIYFSSEIDDTKKVADEFVKTFYFFLKEKDYRPSEITKHFQNYMKDIFDDLDVGFKYSHLDKEDNVWFSSNRENEEYFYTTKESNEKSLFTIDELSTGEKTLLSKVLYLYFQDYKDKVILIDEPELSLHPSWQNRVLKIYENFALKNSCQIIIATHSPHIIGSAKPEYIRLLKKEDNKIVAIDNIDRSYGLEFDKILTDIMGLEDLRTPAVAKDIRILWELLEDEEYESKEYQTLYQKLEDILGELDEDMVLARLEVARIKSRNAKS